MSFVVYQKDSNVYVIDSSAEQETVKYLKQTGWLDKSYVRTVVNDMVRLDSSTPIAKINAEARMEGNLI